MTSLGVRPIMFLSVVVWEYCALNN